MAIFTNSKPLTFGIEMELQIINESDGLLSPTCAQLMATLPAPVRRLFMPEATRSTIEFVSTVHDEPDSMLREAHDSIADLIAAGRTMGLELRGGGNHAMHFWSERLMSDTERGELLSAKYGFLPKRFSTYGLHVHIGMPDANSAIRVGNVLTKLTPMFIALSAASPFHQGFDTGFCAARPLESLVYPFSGPMPAFADWEDFQCKTEQIYQTGLASSLKDLYWDVRPKPEYGTIEVRSFDMPLQVEKAVALAVFVRRCAAMALDGQLSLPEKSLFNLDNCNRFLACRDGINAQLINPFNGSGTSIRDWFTCLIDQAGASGCSETESRHLASLKNSVANRCDAQWMRTQWKEWAGHQQANLGQYCKQLSLELLAPGFAADTPAFSEES